MTRETKVGLMMVALLVGVFGFLIYQRIHRPLEGLAVQDSQEIRTTQATEDDRDQSDLHSLEQDRHSKHERPSASSLLAKEGISASPPRLEERSSGGRSSEWKNSLPQTAMEVNDSKPFQHRTTYRKSTHPVEEAETAEVAFDELNTFAKTPQVIAEVSELPSTDPFADEIVAASNEDPSSESAPDRLPRPLAMPPEVEEDIPTEEPSFDADLDSESSPELNEPSEDSTSDGRARPRQIHQTSEFDTELQNPPLDERRPAPVTFDEKPFSPESTTRAVPLVRGASYVIEPNDNFWSISRKQYGEGRYYMALARHNEQIISDPKRMRPGTTIATPDVAVLEKQYPDLIPKPAGAGPSTAVAHTKSRKAEEAGLSGFFVSPDGLPMYRIAGQDTLSDIAKSHLGRSSRWVQILEMNRNVLRDGNDLKIGTVLRLPADASRVQVVGTTREFR